jgi:PTH1 family peptidyl-tRNA hydrolase
MLLIVGLGNPGHRYEGTRHNLGFMVVDRYAESVRAPFREGKGDFWVAQADLDDVPLLLIKPTTYMNDSGLAVQQALEIYGSTIDETLIVYDDFQIPLGSLRLRKRGTDGGHNGMASVMYHTQTDTVARLRCGIGSPEMSSIEGSSIGFVLSAFTRDEEPVVRSMIDRATEGIATIVRNGFDQAMNQINRNPDQNG